MKKKQIAIQPTNIRDLRTLAEEHLKKRHLTTQHSHLSSTSSPEEMLRLVHELEVHQIELEMEQNELASTRVELETSLAKYTELYDFAPAGYLTLGRDSKIQKANLSATTMLGVDRSQVVGLYLKQFVLPEDYRVIDNILETVFTKREKGYGEVRLSADPFHRPKVTPLLSGSTVRIDAGIGDDDDVCRVILVDITEQKRIAESLIESKTRFSLALETASAGVWEWYLKTNELIWSDEIWQLSGLKNGGEKPTFKLWENSIHPDVRELVVASVTAAVKHEAELNFEYQVCYPDGSVHWNMSRGRPLRNKQGEADRYIGTVIDITDRKLAENQLIKLSRAIQQSPAIVLITDSNGNIEFVNPMFSAVTGYSSEEVKGKNPRILKSGLVPKSTYEDLWKTISSGGVWRGEFINKKKNGELYHESEVISALVDSTGVISNFVAVKEDITERNKTEQLFGESRVKLDAALASMSDAVFISDTKGDFINYNEAFATFHKFRNKESCPLVLEEYPKILEVYLLTGELVPLENWVVPRALRGETGTGVEFRLLRTDSGETWFGSYNYAPIHNKEGDIVGSVVTARDISEQKAAEEKIKGYVQQLEKAMQSTLQAVENVVEAHDPYTAGHERRVGIIAADIAREMGWSEERCQSLKLVGLVHDIGKISIPAEILSKPALLTPIEFELVKTHAEQGYQILKDVEFPLPIARIIREHHERMDGSGYPQGLKGDEALLEARILAVADVLEAMASHRPYRPAFGIEETLHEIESHRAQQFDPDAVDAMLRLFREKGYQLPD